MAQRPASGPWRSDSPREVAALCRLAGELCRNLAGRRRRGIFPCPRDLKAVTFASAGTSFHLENSAKENYMRRKQSLLCVLSLPVLGLLAASSALSQEAAPQQ